MFVITQHQPAGEKEFREKVALFSSEISKEPGFIKLNLVKSTDEPVTWILIQEWDLIGNARRAINSSKNRMIVWPVLSTALDQPSFFEKLYEFKDCKGENFDSALNQSDESL